MGTKESIELKVSYQKRWAGDGSVYRKFIRMPRKVYQAFNLALQSEIAMLKAQAKKYGKGIISGNDYNRLMLLETWVQSERPGLIDGVTKGEFFYPTLTQSHLFIEWAKRQHEIKIDAKRASGKYNIGFIVE